MTTGKSTAGVVNATKRQILVFGVIGLTTVILDFASYQLYFLLGLDINISKCLGFTTGALFAYFANRDITFRAKGGTKTLTLFCCVYLVNLVLNVVSNAFFLGAFSDLESVMYLAFILATAISATSNFLGMKFIVFRISK